MNEQKPSYQIEPGDWVRFYNGGVLVIGKAEYVVKNKSFPGFNVKTDIGSVDSEYILEVRKPNNV
jgi:hypothetical protein